MTAFDVGGTPPRPSGRWGFVTIAETRGNRGGVGRKESKPLHIIYERSFAMA